MKYGMRERVSGIIIVIALLIIFIPFLIGDPESREERPEPSLAIEQPVEVPRHDLEDPAPPPRLKNDADREEAASASDQASASSSAQTPPQVDHDEPASSEDRAPEDPIARLAKEAEQRQATSADNGSAEEDSAAGNATAKATPGGEWAVQVGSFGNADNASGLEKRLNEKGYPAYRRNPGDDMTRVYVGPYATSEAAEGVMAKLKAELNQQGLLVRTGQ